jgi:hypothetical protein
MNPDTYFYASQRAWIQDDSPLKLAVKSRQIGFSYCNAYLSSNYNPLTTTSPRVAPVVNGTAAHLQPLTAY